MTDRYDYLVLHEMPSGLCAISIEAGDTEYKHRIDSWAMDRPEVVTFARLRMANALRRYHVAGTYDNRAMYALPFEEMRRILTQFAGPSDRDRYDAAVAREHADDLMVAIDAHRTSTRFAATVTNGLLKTVWLVTWRIVRYLLIMLVAAITLGKIGRR